MVAKLGKSSLIICRGQRVDRRLLRFFHVGLFTESGQIAAAYYISALDIKYSCHLPDDVTIFSGELTAINFSLLWIKHNYAKPEGQGTR